MNLFSFFRGAGVDSDCELPELFPLAVRADAFTAGDIFTTYLKILTDTMERTHGLPEKVAPLLWDNCVQSESGEGLVSMLAKAMAEMSDLFVVYKPSVGVLRRATREEEQQIRADYTKDGKSSTGVWISFKDYRRTEMLRVYSALEFCVLSSLNKSMNLAKSVQIKISDLRGSVALTDVEVATAQGKAIAGALSRGRDVMLDAKDQVEVPTIDMSPTEKAMLFLDSKKAFVLSLPMSYIAGEQTAGIGSTGEADMRAVERGLKQYWVSIVRPAVKAVFDAETKFKSQDTRQIASALEALKTFDLVSDDILPHEAKIQIVARMFDIDPDELEQQLEDQADEEPTAAPALAVPPAAAAPGGARA